LKDKVNSFISQIAANKQRRDEQASEGIKSLFSSLLKERRNGEQSLIEKIAQLKQHVHEAMLPLVNGLKECFDRAAKEAGKLGIALNP
jgi:hypothetical protein